MTPQDQAIADLLQISLFKLGDGYHDLVKRLRTKGIGTEAELSEITQQVEQMIDDTLADFHKNGADFSMRSVDLIHKKIMDVQKMYRD